MIKTLMTKPNKSILCSLIFYRYFYNSSRTSEVIAYGNAVVIEPVKNYVPAGGIGNYLEAITLAQ
ncbi:MAG: hypothetical protein LUE64_00540 [Candidatus Gastranaerophilales bacterium]|nr:hypothetical protein [Candidatus Gastranaerophilales bacterium]